MGTFLAVFLRPSKIYSRIAPETLGQALSFAMVSSTLFNLIVWLINAFSRALGWDILRTSAVQAMDVPLVHLGKAARILGFDLQMDPSLVTMISKLMNVILTPFVTLVALAVATISIWIGLKVFFSPATEEIQRRYNFRSLLSLQAYGSVLQFLVLIPFLGVVLAWFWPFLFSLNGIKQIYKVSTIRGICILSVPLLTMMVLVFAGGLILSVLIGGLFLGTRG